MIDATHRGPSLLVFSDDWGRHPSSCQHLVRRLVGRYEVSWVNTIGTRTPRLDWDTVKRGWEKLRQWKSRAGDPVERPVGLSVHNPRMWPWFSRGWDRRLNRTLLTRQLTRIVEDMPQPVIAVTTLPITADLVGRLPVAKWCYYCVDDFSVWPGLDGQTLKRMDDEMLQSADDVIVVSETLRDIAAEQGRDAEMLTHGVDLDFWQYSDETSEFLSDLERPWVLFWGCIDRRLDREFVERLSGSLTRGTLLFVGPQNDPDPAVLNLPRTHFHSPVALEELPKFAAAADVLMMPYADLPVTRAMQPLKLKEYLATGKPVVVRDLPAILDWSDSMDMAHTSDEFAAHVRKRLADGIDPSQVTARERLQLESWDAKAAQFESWLLDVRRPSKAAEAANV